MCHCYSLIFGGPNMLNFIGTKLCYISFYSYILNNICCHFSKDSHSDWAEMESI